MDSEGKTVEYSARKSSQLMQCLQVIGIGLREPSDRERDIVGNDWIHLGQEVDKGNWRLCNRVNFGCDMEGRGSLGANAWTPFQIIAKLH